MPLLLPGQVLKLNKKDADFIAGAIDELITDQEQTYSPLFSDIEVWWSWYEAKPEQPDRDWPFKNASNLIVPLIQVMSDGLVNRLFGMIFAAGNRIWTARTENEDLEKHAKDVVTFLNWAADDNDFNFKMAIHDWLSELVPIGSSVMALNWREQRQWRFASQRGKRIETRLVSLRQGPTFEHVPREQILWDTSYSIADAPMITREFHYNWNELCQFATGDAGWDVEALKGVRDHGGLESPGSSVTQSKRQADSAEVTTSLLPHDVRQVHLDWPVLQAMGFRGDQATPSTKDPETPSVPLVFTLHRRTRMLLQAKAEPYLLPYKPFFDGYFKKRPGRGHSVGLAKKLEHMQDAMNVLLNQAIDARTRANSIWAKTDRRELLQRVIDPRHPIYVPQGAMFEELSLQSNVLQDTSLFSIVNILAERLTGQADPNFGRESRQGGHPSPATSTLALLAQSDQMIGTTRELLRQQVSRMGEAAASLYQQFETDDTGRLARTLGLADAGRVKEYLFPTDPLIGLMEFDVLSMSETLNPQAEVNRLVTLTQMNVNYWSVLSNALQVLGQSGAVPPPVLAQLVAQTAMSTIKAQTLLQERLLAAGGVDDVERLILVLRGGLQQSQQDLAGAGQLLGAATGQGALPGFGGPVPGAPVAGPAGLNGGGAPPALGGPRLQ